MKPAAWRLFLILLASLILPSVAVAQFAPVAAQTDIYARIQVAGFAIPVELRRSGLKTRLDVTSGGIVQSYIADREKGVLIVLTTTAQSRLALVFPLDRNEPILPLPLDLGALSARATVKPVGTATLAGKPCRVMAFSGYLNQSGTLCASADNIILQMTKQGHNEPLFQVSEIAMAHQDAKWFRPPTGYQIAVMPGLGGASTDGLGLAQPMPPK